MEDKKFWMGIWKARGLSPILKLFLWRCARNTIPVRGVIGARIATIPTIFQVCNSGPKTAAYVVWV